MITISTYKIKIVLLGVATLFLACDDSREKELSYKSPKGEPIGIAYEVRMVYTDSTKVKAILTAPIHEDFTNLSLRHSTFPKGVKVIFIDDLNQKNTITADQGTMYENTGIIDLVGNVVLEASDGGILTTSQLYWDAEQDWIFTEQNFHFVNYEYDVDATRLDTNKEFTKFKTGKLTGTVEVSEQ